MNMLIDVNGERREMSEDEMSSMLASFPAHTGPILPPLTARQLRLGLVTNGFSLEQVDVVIRAIGDPQQRALSQIEWAYASQFERRHPLIAEVGAALGLSAEQIDTMWAASAEI